MDKNDIRARMEEEYSDAELYERMVEEWPLYGGMLNDIAMEERQHAEILKYIHSHMEE